MDLTITLGWWLMPLAVTAVCFGLAVANFSHSRGDYSFPEVYNAMLLLVATIPVLVAWLIWALIG